MMVILCNAPKNFILCLAIVTLVISLGNYRIEAKNRDQKDDERSKSAFNELLDGLAKSSKPREFNRVLMKVLAKYGQKIFHKAYKEALPHLWPYELTKLWKRIEAKLLPQPENEFSNSLFIPSSDGVKRRLAFPIEILRQEAKDMYLPANLLEQITLTLIEFDPLNYSEDKKKDFFMLYKQWDWITEMEEGRLLVQLLAEIALKIKAGILNDLFTTNYDQVIGYSLNKLSKEEGDHLEALIRHIEQNHIPLEMNLKNDIETIVKTRIKFEQNEATAFEKRIRYHYTEVLSPVLVQVPVWNQLRRQIDTMWSKELHLAMDYSGAGQIITQLSEEVISATARVFGIVSFVFAKSMSDLKEVVPRLRAAGNRAKADPLDILAIQKLAKNFRASDTHSCALSNLFSELSQFLDGSPEAQNRVSHQQTQPVLDMERQLIASLFDNPGAAESRQENETRNLLSSLIRSESGEYESPNLDLSLGLGPPSDPDTSLSLVRNGSGNEPATTTTMQPTTRQMLESQASEPGRFRQLLTDEDFELALGFPASKKKRRE